MNEMAQAAKAHGITGGRDRRPIAQSLRGGVKSPPDEISMRRQAAQLAKDPREVIRAHASGARKAS
jgi:hypothetical protein